MIKSYKFYCVIYFVTDTFPHMLCVLTHLIQKQPHDSTERLNTLSTVTQTGNGKTGIWEVWLYDPCSQQFWCLNTMTNMVLHWLLNEYETNSSFVLNILNKHNKKVPMLLTSPEISQETYTRQNAGCERFCRFRLQRTEKQKKQTMVFLNNERCFPLAIREF